MASGDNQKLPLLALTAMVVGSMVGAGIFNLPGRFGAATGPFGAIIAWLIAGTGMYMLARVFQMLAEKKPDIDSGVFASRRQMLFRTIHNIVGMLDRERAGYEASPCADVIGNQTFKVPRGAEQG